MNPETPVQGSESPEPAPPLGDLGDSPLLLVGDDDAPACADGMCA